MIDIILPTRNRPTMLACALDSIQVQTWQDFTIYVVNDGGEDVSVLVESYPKTVYLSHAERRGLGAARNTGIYAGSGKFIAYLDDDDWWMPWHLKTLIDGMHVARFIYSDAWFSNEMGITLERRSPDFSIEKLSQDNLMPVNAVMHERSLFDECGVFDDTLPSHEDYDLWLRFAMVTPFLHVREFTCWVSIREDSGRMSQHRDMKADREMVQRRYAHA